MRCYSLRDCNLLMTLMIEVIELIEVIEVIEVIVMIIIHIKLYYSYEVEKPAMYPLSQ